MKKIMLTGDRPTGKLHVGHYVGSLRRRVELQNTGDFDDIFIMIADAQALTDNADNPEKIRQNIIEVALDYLACGLDPAKSTLFIQSQIPELCELSLRQAFRLDSLLIRSARQQISQHSRQRPFLSGKIRCRCWSRQKRSYISLILCTVRLW